MELINQIYKAVDDKQGEDIVVLDFKGHSAFLDYFIICTASNSRKANSIVDNVEDVCALNGIEIISKSVNKDSGWSLVDAGSVVVHIFTQEERAKYNLEGLWKDLMIEL